MIVVFPFVPVMPTIVSASAGRPNSAADSGPIAARTDATRSCGTSRSSHRSTTRAPAPARTAATANACPSAVPPGMQKKSEPGGTLRESYAASPTRTPASPRISAPTTSARPANAIRCWGRSTDGEGTRRAAGLMGWT